MRMLLLVMLQSFVLTVFFTMISQADVRTFPTKNCRDNFFNLKKYERRSEAPKSFK
ncbi:MAG TPA: hypothetical protein VIG33_14935 [Pseudobdellovibrionaceae bacterium]